MQTIEIRNVGPLRHVEMELKQFNFFIGEQGSGKSTIAKIVSFCNWMEKEVLTNPDLDGNNYREFEELFAEWLSHFHLMNGYLRQDSYIHYHSECIDLGYEDGWGEIKVHDDVYERKKILYIPAERNYAIRKYDVTREDNIKSFVRDYVGARDFYGKNNRLLLPGLKVEYYGQMTSDGRFEDRIVFEGQYDIKLENGSSGMQSMSPVVVAIDFYSSKFYEPGVENKMLSVTQDRDRREVRNYINDLYPEEKERWQVIDRLLTTHNTVFVIEEPEQNLYPTTQRDLLNFIVLKCSGERKHQALVTTHSPYLINQLNLLFAAHDKGKKIDGASLNFDDVNVYAVEEGTVKDLKVKNEGVHLVDTVRLSEDIDAIYDQYDQLQ